MLRAILSTLGGLLAAFLTISVLEILGHSFWPPPADVDWNNRESVRTALAALPFGALLWVAVGWVAGTFGGGWLAARCGHRRWPAYVVGGFVAAASVANLMMLPHPFWFWIVALILVPTTSFAAAALAAPPATRMA